MWPASVCSVYFRSLAQFLSLKGTAVLGKRKQGFQNSIDPSGSTLWLVFCIKMLPKYASPPTTAPVHSLGPSMSTSQPLAPPPQWLLTRRPQASSGFKANNLRSFYGYKWIISSYNDSPWYTLIKIDTNWCKANQYGAWIFQSLPSLVKNLEGWVSVKYQTASDSVRQSKRQKAKAVASGKVVLGAVIVKDRRGVVIFSLRWLSARMSATPWYARGAITLHPSAWMLQIDVLAIVQNFPGWYMMIYVHLSA